MENILLHPWSYRVAPFRIAGRLFYVGNAGVSCHLIDTGDGLILIDTAFPQTVYLLLESIRRLGFDPDAVRLILHTHAHYDHFGGTRAVVELTGAKTALGRDDLPVLTDRPELSWAPEYGVEFHETFAVDRPLADGDRITLGDTTVECVHIPGHTAGTFAYLFTIRDGAWAYRAGLHGGPGLNTLTDEYLTRYGLPQSLRQAYLDSLDRLKREPVDILLGAHPSQNDTLGKRARQTGTHNPFLDPLAWPAYLADLERRAREAEKRGHSTFSSEKPRS